VTHGYVREDHKQALLGRLRRAEGQVRGLQKMIEDERYCIDILTQVSATCAALDGVALEVLKDHVLHCVREGGEERVTEVTDAIERLIRSR
jgi:CsoR family transcriptional regulator, copper-sensing transcriptional repressor